jgi:hypothetical protein
LPALPQHRGNRPAAREYVAQSLEIFNSIDANGWQEEAKKSLNNSVGANVVRRFFIDKYCFKT